MSEPTNTPATTTNSLPPGHPLATNTGASSITVTTPTINPPAPAQAPAKDDADTTDWKAEARKWEARSKENADKAKRFDEVEEASKTEAQKLVDRLAQAEADAKNAQADAHRFRAAAKYGISDEDAALFLTASDPEQLEKQAARLAASVTQTPGHVPAEGRTPATQALNGDGLEQALRAKLGIT